jgi:hypothetical protein
MDGRVHRSYVDFSMDFTGVGTILKATLVVFTGNADGHTPGAKARIVVQRLLKEFREIGSGTGWTTASDINPSFSSTHYEKALNKTINGATAVDITALARYWKSHSKDRHGVAIRADSETDRAYAFTLRADESGTPSYRPYIEIEYDPTNYAPDLINTITPSGATLPDEPFKGQFGDPNGDRPEQIEVDVHLVSNDDHVWSVKVPFDNSWLETGGVWNWEVPNPGSSKLKAKKDYHWRAQGTDAGGKTSPWTGWRAFRIDGVAPTVVLRPITPQDTLDNVWFLADWTVEAGESITSYRVQLRDAGGTYAQPLWDHSFIPLREEERNPPDQSAPHIQFQYHGQNLIAGTYYWRVMVVDTLGQSSLWSTESQIVLNLGSEPDTDGGGLGFPPNATGYMKVRSRVRIVLKDIDTANERRPGTVKAIIEDASNIGMSAYVNAPGEFFFTLPNSHPQVGECEPWQRHYALQQYRNGNWQTIANGLLTDFEAGHDDVVVYGLDYLGILSRSVDTRFPPKDTPIDADHAHGGAKYIEKRIDTIIKDQLDQARADTDSPTKFIHRGVIDSLDSEITIWSSFRARLDFIAGLIDSYRQGTGKRTRIRARYDPSQFQWEWDLRASPGVDRDNLRLEYGSLLNGYRVVAMGTDFATRAHGIGTTPNTVKPVYAMDPAKGASDVLTGAFGNIQRVEMWNDVTDYNDVKRRVKQMRKESAKVGKRIALAIRVDGIDPFDGYDLTDNIPLDIDDGVVETERYGSGYWTIWGLEWRLSMDGHDETSWVVRPREDDEPPDTDLIPSDPVHDTPEWQVGNGAPAPPSVTSLYYLDLDTGAVYTQNPDGTYDLTGTIPAGDTIINGSGPPDASVGEDGNYYIDTDTGIMYGPKDSAGTPVWPVAISGVDPDSTPPGPVTGLVAEPTVYLREDGTLISGFDIDWVDPVGVTDIGWYDLEFSTDPTFAAPGQRAPTAHPYHLEPVSAQVVVDIDGIPKPIAYHFRVRAVDLSENRLEWDDPVTPPPVVTKAADTDPWAPDIPENVTPSPGYRQVSLSWPRVDFPDLSRYGVRYTGPKRTAAGVPIVPHEADTDAWIDLSTLSTRIIIANLDPLLTYWFEVRAIDRSGQVRAYRDPIPPDEIGPQPIAVYASVEGEAGWSVRTPGVHPEALPPDDVTPDVDVADFLATGIFDADLIKTGTIRIDNDPHLEAFDASGNLTARWDALGALYLDPSDSSRAMWITESEIRVSDQYTGDVGTTVWRVLTSAEGISASDIHWGIVPGGHNLMPNAGFELAPFPTTVNSVKTWTDAAHWGTGTDQVNVAVAGADLTLTTATY